jgi:hypothetical protein
MNRRAFVAGLGAVPAAPLDGKAQPSSSGAPLSKKVWRIGLFHVGLDHVPPSLEGLRAGLTALGY